MVHLHGWRQNWSDVSVINPKIIVNGNEAKFARLLEDGYAFDLTKETAVKDVKICSTTFVPSQAGINNDDRQLGLDIESIVFQ